MKKEKVSKKKAGISLGTVLGIMVIAFIMMFNLPSPSLDEDWNIVWSGSLVSAAENNPGAGASGFLQFFVINHSATPYLCYNENTSATMEGWCTAANLGFASADQFNIEIAHSVTFDLVCRVRFNRTHAHTGAAFNGNHTRVNITCSGDLVIADATGANVPSYNNSAADYIFINVFWNNAGAGYSINKDQTFDVDEFSIEAYY